jgi:hypothetical protein
MAKPDEEQVDIKTPTRGTKPGRTPEEQQFLDDWADGPLTIQQENLYLEQARALGFIS